MSVIWDCFPFLDEFEVLAARLALLTDAVDVWVISQSDKTHRGRSKPRYLTLDHPLVEAYGVERFRLVDFSEPFQSTWRSEKGQRMALASVLRAEARPGDVVLLSDVDELPNPEAISQFVDSDRPITSLPMRHCFVFPNLTAGSTWLHAKAFRFRESSDLNQVRRNAVPSVVRAMGVHLTVRGDWADAWGDKGAKTLHSEDFDSPAHADESTLQRCRALHVLPRRDAALYLGLPKCLPESKQNDVMKFLIQDMEMRSCDPPLSGLKQSFERRSLGAAVCIRIPGFPKKPWREWTFLWKVAAFVFWIALAPARWGARARRFLAYRGYRKRLQDWGESTIPGAKRSRRGA